MNLLFLFLISTANSGKHIALMKMEAVHMFPSGTGVTGFCKDCIKKRKQRVSRLLFPWPRNFTKNSTVCKLGKKKKKKVILIINLKK